MQIKGQSFLCVSLDTNGVEQAASELQYQNPNTYDSLIPSNLQSLYPQMTAVYDGTRQFGSHVVEITSSGGTTFTSFSKDNTWGKDFYDQLVQPYYQEGFEWETWRRSPYLPSICDATYETLNVDTISLGTYQFKYTRDHAKWGVSLSGSTACVGGINRMQSQRKRGGGALCLTSGGIWGALKGVVATTEPCPSSTTPMSTTTDMTETDTDTDVDIVDDQHGKVHIRKGPAPRKHGHPGGHGEKHFRGHQDHHKDSRDGHRDRQHRDHQQRRHHGGKPHGKHGHGGGGGGGGGWWQWPKSNNNDFQQKIHHTLPVQHP